MNVDYKAVAALDAVISLGSFDLAAQKLFITQSAISQRIKQLEQNMAQPLLIRSVPPKPTEAGQRLLGLYQQVKLLEQEWWPDKQLSVTELSLASNHDSLALWLLPALRSVLSAHEISLNIVMGDEKHTLEKLRSGEVLAAISAEKMPLKGCSSDYLGQINYRCVASPDFYERYFFNGVTSEALKAAPAVIFDQYDEMHHRFLEAHFGLKEGQWRYHTLRSPEAFITMAELDIGYGMIPDLMIEDKLKSGHLVDLLPNHGFARDLYWHRWALEQGILAEVTDAVLNKASFLPQYQKPNGVY
ncbi:LysR family transcriptional regulator ArgP [Vibrio genomosp. F10]|uniref:Transcriptional regulator ArgP n=1 Tax=Vibrio genomosp. F10 str. ZF-129 TaxID=1187848 RepID=A0A1E5BA82_9VIBR|nr:LysR family transcriptional regulator ArgP [Vibrio genomosp. F10]OEE30819.1 transcriptional regulator ArgP [Vibrio genomosp. F10 str. ZF-129]OEF11972.1 transcriptional regulator ArgP [Vibrio genomosp. F10 str. 9ZD137]